MKSRFTKGTLFVIFGLFISSVYLNCTGGFKAKDADSKALNDPGNRCTNGAVNDICTVDLFNRCINKNDNPPTCTDGTDPADNLCLNGALKPDCILKPDNTCANLATNPPDCTQLQKCDNGAIDYPTCSPPNARVFNVTLTKSGTLSEMNIKIDLELNDADYAKSGAIFIFAKLDNKIMVCKNPCSSNIWEEWQGDLTAKDWSATGFRTTLEINPLNTSGIETILNGKFDVTTLGGYSLYVGYGLGSDVSSAVNDMINFRSTTLPEGRFMHLFDVTKQAMDFKFSASGTLTNYNLTAFVYPSYLDYGKPGYFFVYTTNPNDPAHPSFFYYYNSTTSNYEWKLWDGKMESVVAFNSDAAIMNESIPVVTNTNLTDYKDWPVVIGYGLGSDIISAATDCLNNKKNNSSNPFIVK